MSVAIADTSIATSGSSHAASRSSSVCPDSPGATRLHRFPIVATRAHGCTSWQRWFPGGTDGNGISLPSSFTRRCGWRVPIFATTSSVEPLISHLSWSRILTALRMALGSPADSFADAARTARLSALSAALRARASTVSSASIGGSTGCSAGAGGPAPGVPGAGPWYGTVASVASCLSRFLFFTRVYWPRGRFNFWCTSARKATMIAALFSVGPAWGS